MSVRKLGLVVAAMCAALLVVPVAASAQSTPVPVTSFSHIPVTGTANNGKAFKGHFNVAQFVTRNGKTYALGTLTGRVGNRFINRSNVAIPASMGNASTARDSGASNSHAVASPAATCPILNLVLGPLHLNLLGLHVDLNQVVLNITAVSGPGQLLGNLLCAVANLLNGTGLPTGTALTPAELTGLLNVLTQALNVPGLLTL
jgi:hypothetical protein